MSKTPKRPSQRDDHRQQDGGAGAQRPKSPTRKPHIASKKKAGAVLDSLDAEISTGVTDGPRGTVSSLLPPQDETLATDSSVVAEGNQNWLDQQGTHSRIRDETEQPVQTVVLADGLAPTEPNQGVTSDPSRPTEVTKVRINPASPVVHNLQSDSREDAKSSSRIAPEGTTQRGIWMWSPRLQAAPNRVRGASGRAEVWAHERAASRAHESNEALRSANPIYILAAITLGIPALLLIPLVGMNPGVQDGTFTTVVTFLVVSAFVTAAVFEIKRLADEHSDSEPH